MSILFIVATPIGNLNDISMRALEILKSVSVIASEDTRHSQKLLNHYNINQKLISYHDHNERESVNHLIKLLNSGQSIALITDAGTPLISDPGYHLVKAAHENNIKVVPIPGACAVTAALSVSGLPSGKFIFEGFLPASSHARQSRLELLKLEMRTLIFYEAPHRLIETLEDLGDIFGKDRLGTLAREMTKNFETIYKADVGRLYHFVKSNPCQTKGESVLVIAGMSDNEQNSALNLQAKKLLLHLLQELPLKKAVKITADITKISKNMLYDEALKFKIKN